MLFDVGMIIAALVFFTLFVNALVRFSFPEGARLTNTMVRQGTAVVQTGDRGVVDIASTAGNFAYFRAILGDVHRDVKIRPAESVAWTSARKGAPVNRQDAVQTFSNSRARIDFEADKILNIGQNSLVVFSGGATDPFLTRTTPAVVMMSGELTGQITSASEAFGIEFPAGLVELKSADSSGDAVNFRIGVNPDESSTIAVYSGQADVNIAGTHYKVGASEGLTIGRDGATSGVLELPAVPVLRQPGNNAAVRFLQRPPKVTFAWNRAGNSNEYRFELAADKGFDEILVDEYLAENSFVHRNLGAGDYHWRVSGVNGGVHGKPAPARRLRIVRDTAPPVLQIQPIAQIDSQTYVIRGHTTGNATIYILGERVDPSADGSFEFRFKPMPGTQTIVIESIDDLGNAAYSSQLLHVPGTSGRSR